MSNSYGGFGIAADVVISASEVVISEIDISEPSAMKVRRTMTMEGALVDARLTGGTARVVVGASPDYIRPAAIASASLRRFVPRTVLRSNVSGRTFRRSVVPCDDVRHPRRFSGLDLLTVLTIDLDKGLFNVDRDAIMAGAQTVYASKTGLYVASRRYVAGGRGRPHRPAVQQHRHPPLRHLQAGRHDVRVVGQRHGLRAQPVLDVGVRRRAARRLDRGAGLVRWPAQQRQPVLRDRARPAGLAPRSGSAASAASATASGSTRSASRATRATSSRSARSTRSTRSTSPARRTRASSAS